MTAHNVLAIGDSRTAVTLGLWIPLLQTEKNIEFPEVPTRIAGDGWTSTTVESVIDARLAARNETPEYVFINLGVTDYAITSEADYKTAMLYVIDAVHTKYPSAKIYTAKPWKKDDGGWSDIFAGYIDDIIASRPGVAYLGHDERVWLEGGDDGATMTTDGRHYTAAGQTECAAQWRSVIGI